MITGFQIQKDLLLTKNALGKASKYSQTLPRGERMNPSRSQIIVQSTAGDLLNQGAVVEILFLR